MALSVTSNTSIPGDKTSAASKSIASDSFSAVGDIIIYVFAWQGSVSGQTLSFTTNASTWFDAVVLAQRQASGKSGLAILMVRQKPGVIYSTAVLTTIFAASASVNTGTIVAWGADRLYITGAGPETQVAWVGADSAASTSTAPTATSGSAAIGDLVIGALALSGPTGDTFTQDTDTTGGSWTTIGGATPGGTSGGSATTNETVRGAYKIATAAGTQTYNPTLGTARNYAELIGALRPRTAVSGSDANSGSDSPVAKISLVSQELPSNSSGSSLPALVQNSAPVMQASTDTLPTIAFPSATGAGNLLVLYIHFMNSLDPLADPALTMPAGWIRVNHVNNPDAELAISEVWVYPNNPGGITTISGVGHTSTFTNCILMLSEYSGVPASSVVDVATTDPASTVDSSMSITPTNADDMLLVLLADTTSDGVNPTLPSGFTQDGNNNIDVAGTHMGFVVAHKFQVGTSPITITEDNPANGISTWASQAIAIKPGISYSSLSSESASVGTGATSKTGTDSGGMSTADGVVLAAQESSADVNSTTTDAASLAAKPTGTDQNGATTEAQAIVSPVAASDVNGATTETNVLVGKPIASDANGSVTEAPVLVGAFTTPDANSISTEAQILASQIPNADANSVSTENFLIRQAASDVNGSTTEQNVLAVQESNADANSTTTENGSASQGVVPVSSSDVNGATTEQNVLASALAGSDASGAATEGNVLASTMATPDVSGGVAEAMGIGLVSSDKIVGGVTPNFVQGNWNNNSANGTSLNAAYPGGVTQGNLLIVAVESQWNGSTIPTPTITDSRGNVYTLAVQVDSTDATFKFSAWIYIAVAKDSGANTVTFDQDLAGAFRRIAVHEYVGINTLDQVATGSGSTGVPQSSSVTTTQPNEIAFAWGVSNGGITAAGSGWTLRENASSESTEDLSVPTSGSSVQAIYPSGSTPWIVAMATFYGVGVGGSNATENSLVSSAKSGTDANGALTEANVLVGAMATPDANSAVTENGSVNQGVVPKSDSDANGATTEINVLVGAMATPDANGFTEATNIGLVSSDQPPPASISDNFNRANEVPLASPWTMIGPSHTWSLQSNQLRGPTVQGDDYAYRAGAASSPDQFSEFTVVQAAAANDYGPAVRVSGGDTTQNGYFLEFNPTFPSGGVYLLGKHVNGTYTEVGHTGSGVAGPQVGDVMRLEVQGNQLRGYRNGVLVISLTDNSLSSGQPGLFDYDLNGIADSWNGGNLVAGSDAVENATVTQGTTSKSDSDTNGATTEGQVEVVGMASADANAVTTESFLTRISGSVDTNGGTVETNVLASRITAPEVNFVLPESNLLVVPLTATDANGATTEAFLLGLQSADVNGVVTEASLETYQALSTDANLVSTEFATTNSPKTGSDANGTTTEATNQLVTETAGDANSTTIEAGSYRYPQTTVDANSATTETTGETAQISTPDANGATTDAANVVQRNPVSSTDANGAPVEAFALTARPNATDTASGADQAVLKALSASQDASAAGQDVASLVYRPTGTDTGAGSDVGSIQYKITGTDLGTGNETLTSVGIKLTGSDIGSGADTGGFNAVIYSTELGSWIEDQKIIFSDLLPGTENWILGSEVERGEIGGIYTVKPGMTKIAGAAPLATLLGASNESQPAKIASTVSPAKLTRARK